MSGLFKVIRSELFLAVGLVLAGCSVGFASTSCFAAGGTAECCQNYGVPCTGPFGEIWACPQTSSAGSCVIRYVLSAGSGVMGSTGYESQLKCECDYTNSICGNKPGQCLSQSGTQHMMCMDSFNVGTVCTGQ
jgi:hypothetical protein